MKKYSSQVRDVKKLLKSSKEASSSYIHRHNSRNHLDIYIRASFYVSLILKYIRIRDRNESGKEKTEFIDDFFGLIASKREVKRDLMLNLNLQIMQMHERA